MTGSSGASIFPEFFPALYLAPFAMMRFSNKFASIPRFTQLFGPTERTSPRDVARLACARNGLSRARPAVATRRSLDPTCAAERALYPRNSTKRIDDEPVMAPTNL